MQKAPHEASPLRRRHVSDQECTLAANLALGGHWGGYAEAAAALRDNIVVLPLPKFGAKGVSPNGTWIRATIKTSKHPDIAVKFTRLQLRSGASHRPEGNRLATEIRQLAL